MRTITLILFVLAPSPLLAMDWDMGILLKQTRLNTADYSELSYGMSLGINRRPWQSRPLSLGARAIYTWGANLDSWYTTVEMQYWWRKDNDQTFFPYMRLGLIPLGRYSFSEAFKKANGTTFETSRVDVKLSGKITGIQASFGYVDIGLVTNLYELAAILENKSVETYSIDSVSLSSSSAKKENHISFLFSYGYELK